MGGGGGGAFWDLHNKDKSILRSRLASPDLGKLSYLYTYIHVYLTIFLSIHIYVYLCVCVSTDCSTESIRAALCEIWQLATFRHPCS